MPNMTGRPGCRTTELSAGSSASYLACIPLFCTLLMGVETEGFLEAQRSPGPFGPGTPKESEKSPKGCPAPGSPRVPKECATESEKSPKGVRSCKLRFWTLFGLRGGLFGDSGAPRGGDTLSDSFRTLLGFRARRPGRPLCLAGGFPSLDHKGRAGIIPIVRWNLRPVVFVVASFMEGGVTSGSFARGRCRRGRSEIPHFCSKFCCCLPLS